MDPKPPLESITPELVARLASKIYNERPTEVVADSHAPPMHLSNVDLPATPVPSLQVPSATHPLSHVQTHAPALGPSLVTPAEPKQPPVASQPANGSKLASDNGLRAFVQQVRTSHFSDPVPWARLKEKAPTAARPNGFGPSSGMTDTTGPFNGSGWPTSSGDTLDASSIRRDFPVLQQKIHGHPLAWFDNAATTQKPHAVIDAISHFYRNHNSNIHRGAHTLAARATDAYEQARERVQTFLHARSAKEIVFVRGTTEAVNLAAQTLGRKFLRADDEIVLSHLEHHANIVPWQMVARETGARLRVIPVNNRGEILLDEYRRILSPRTKIVALTQASNSLGTILPVAEMTAMAKAYGAHVLIDGAQSVAHLPVRVAELGCDFFAFSGHKIFGPTGIGVLYVREELHELLPPWQGGGNMIRNVTFEETTYSDAPAKFEAGTPNIADAVGLHAALDYVSTLGLDRIAAYERSLLDYATHAFAEIPGLHMIGSAPEKVALISFVLDNTPNEDVGRALDRAGIAVRVGHHCAQPSLRRFGLEATIRPSFSIYNTRDEIDRMVTVIRALASRGRVEF